jgi:hypothetical protein
MAVVTRRRSGPEPTFDPETAKARRTEMNYRYQLLAKEVANYVAENHPAIYRKAKAHAEAVIEELRGPLPGDE